MRHLLTILAALFLCSAPIHAQTLKSLMYNTTNGAVAYAGTNILTFAAPINLSANNVAISFVVADEDLTSGYDGEIGSLGFGAAKIWVKYGSSQTDWGQLVYLDTNGYPGLRTNLGLQLATLTNTSNVTMMRALSGSTNTNHPYSGSISVVGTNNTNTLVFSNGILQSVQ